MITRSQLYVITVLILLGWAIVLFFIYLRGYDWGTMLGFFFMGLSTGALVRLWQDWWKLR